MACGFFALKAANVKEEENKRGAMGVKFSHPTDAAYMTGLLDSTKSSSRRALANLESRSRGHFISGSMHF